MIPNDDVQAGLITKLKAGNAIVATLSSSNEIKEAQWQGTAFLYPAVRVSVGTQTQDRASPFCNFGFLPFTVRVYSEQKSSQQADDILGKVNAYLHGNYAKGTGFILNNIECIGLTGAIRVSEQLWQSEANYLSLLTNH